MKKIVPAFPLVVAFLFASLSPSFAVAPVVGQNPSIPSLACDTRADIDAIVEGWRTDFATAVSVYGRLNSTPSVLGPNEPTCISGKFSRTSIAEVFAYPGAFKDQNGAVHTLYAVRVTGGQNPGVTFWLLWMGDGKPAPALNERPRPLRPGERSA